MGLSCMFLNRSVSSVLIAGPVRYQQAAPSADPAGQHRHCRRQRTGLYSGCRGSSWPEAWGLMSSATDERQGLAMSFLPSFSRADFPAPQTGPGYAWMAGEGPL